MSFHILCVVDTKDPEARSWAETFRSCFEDRNYSVSCLESCEEVLEYIRKGPSPDLIVADYSISGSQTQDCEVPVLYLVDEKEEQELRASAGMPDYGYLRKPISNLQHLEAQIRLAHRLYLSEQRRVMHERDLLLYTRALNSSKDMVVTVDTSCRYMSVNNAFCDFHGVNREAIIGTPVADLMGKKHFLFLKEHLDAGMEGRRVIFETSTLNSYGNDTFFEVDYEPLRDEQNRIIGVVVTIADITERKKSELRHKRARERLKESEQRFSCIFHHAPISIWEEDICDVRREIRRLKDSGVKDFSRYLDEHPEAVQDLVALAHIVQVNNTTLRMWNASTREEFMTSLEDFFTPETMEVFKKVLVAISNGENEVQGQTIGYTTDGKKLELVFRMYIPSEGAEYDRLLFSIFDITARVEAERELKTTIEEKEYLIGEIHHRIKNNLAMVTSLIDLKTQEIEDRDPLIDLKNKISSIGTVHNMLNMSNEGSRIDFSIYVNDLLREVFTSMSKKEVRSDVRVEEVMLPPETAIPLGLIVNEVATNAVKYGFVEGEENRFTVRGSFSGAGAESPYVLQLCNSGNPMPEDIDLTNTSTLGMRLIESLIRQLGAEMELHREPETCFTIRLPRASQLASGNSTS